MYALSHKSSSTHSAIGDFGTAVDMEEPPVSDEEKSYLETDFNQSSKTGTQYYEKPAQNTTKFIPTEILMDDSTIQIIQSVPEPEPEAEHTLVKNTCPEHSLHVPYITTDQTYMAHTLNSTYPNQSSVPINYPIPSIPLHEGIKFDSISYHLHPHTCHSSHPSAATRGISIHEYMSSTKSSPAPPRTLFSSHSSPSPDVYFDKDPCSYHNSLHNARAHQHSSVVFDRFSRYGPCLHKTTEKRYAMSSDISLHRHGEFVP